MPTEKVLSENATEQSEDDSGGTLLLSSLAIRGYRSFGPEWQRFGKFSKINLFIGQNNCGKSNVLLFINSWLAKTIGARQPVQLGEHDRHLPNLGPIGYGFRLNLPPKSPDFSRINLENIGHQRKVDLLRILTAKANADGDVDGPWYHISEQGETAKDEWKIAFNDIDDNKLSSLWGFLVQRNGGGRAQHWIPETINAIDLARPSYASALIPAIRKIGVKGSTSEEFSGDGIIDRLAKLQNPKSLEQKEKVKFEKICEFLRTVTDNRSATIEIPYERDTILVHMDGKVLPLESLGSGIHEVIILAAASTVLENQVVCMEEPELHLNPILQKKLLRYLRRRTSNQYFITTHSAALMDTPDAEIYHVKLQGGSSRVDRVTSDRHRSEVCQDLGYHPSDLLQTNSIIWVEGPSDRIYLKWWIGALAPSFIEGIHFSIMFYGGRLASHLSAGDESEAVEDFIALRRLNRNGVILIDSDKSSSHSHLNDTKKRLKEEFNQGPGHAWVTEGREIENYLGPELVRVAIEEIHPSATVNSTFDKFENVLTISTRSGKTTQASKVAIAASLVKSGPPDFARFDLKQRVNEVVAFIKASNPG